MKVLYKLILVLFIIAIIPTAISTTIAVGISQRALEQISDSLRRQSVAGAAAFIDRSLREVVRAMRQEMQYADLYRLTPEQREGALTILYLQLETITVVSLLEEEGNGVTPSIYRTMHRSDDPRFANHEPVSIEDHDIYQRHIRLDQARKGETGVSSVYTNTTGSPRMTFCAPMPQGPEGKTWYIAVEISLNEINDYLQVTAPQAGAGFLYDSDGKVILATKDVGQLKRVPALERFAGGVVRFAADGIKQRGAEARIALAGWGVILHQPESVALWPARQIRNQALIWILLGLIVALGLGWALARDLTSPIRSLYEGAKAIAAGELGYRVAVKSRDEIGDLAFKFNQMADELEKRQKEIEKWNLELQERVDERTRELRELEKVASRAQRLASLTELGAGMAHEINNPLCTILGTIQLTEKRFPNHPMTELLKGAENDANRIGEIAKKFLLMATPAGTERARGPMEIRWLLDEVIEPRRDTLEAMKIKTVMRSDKVHPVKGEEAGLRQVFNHLIDNAVEAMPHGGDLIVEIENWHEGAVRIRIRDTGVGFDPEVSERIFDPFFTTKGPRHQGLGLSVAFRIIEEHEGRISIESTPGKGTTVEIILPWAIQDTHLT